MAYRIFPNVGYEPSAFELMYLSCENIQGVSDCITNRLHGKIRVTDEVIRHMLQQIYIDYIPQTSQRDPYSRFLHSETDRCEGAGYGIVCAFDNDSLLKILNDRTVSAIVNHIETEADIHAINNSFSTWNALYTGEYNPCGLQAYPNSMIKLNNRRPKSSSFFTGMRY